MNRPSVTGVIHELFPTFVLFAVATRKGSLGKVRKQLQNLKLSCHMWHQFTYNIIYSTIIWSDRSNRREVLPQTAYSAAHSDL